VLKWAREHHCPWSEHTSTYAAAGGHLEVLKWALMSNCPWEEEEICAVAEQGGHHRVLEFMER
jgi:hypothetical protein